MSFDISKISQAVQDVIGNKSHPDIPDIKVKDYEALARVAAQMFGASRPSADQVGMAFHALKNSELSPSEFERLWPVAKPLANRLLNRDPTMHDLTYLAGQSPAHVQFYYMTHPHPTHPEVSAGDIARYATVSLYPARRLIGREPNITELHKFAMGNYSMDDIVAHYSDTGRSTRSRR